VAERELDKLTDLRKLLAAATKVVVTNSVEVGLLSLAVKRVALGVDDSVGSDNAVWRGVNLDHLEVDSAHAAANLEDVTLADGAVRLEEVGLEVHVEEVAREALDRVGEGKNVNALAILDVVGSRDVDEVAQLGSTVPAGN
jgi:hypothetical protein